MHYIESVIVLMTKYYSFCMYCKLSSKTHLLLSLEIVINENFQGMMTKT